MSFARARAIAQQGFAGMPGDELAEAAEDRVVARLPCREQLGNPFGPPP